MHEFIDQIRNLLTPKHHQVFKKLDSDKNWERFCAALDLMNDTEEVLCLEYEECKGLKIAIYGIMQGFVLQQNAFFELYRCSIGWEGKPKDFYKVKGLEEFRTLRDDVVGHPISDYTRPEKRAVVLFPDIKGDFVEYIDNHSFGSYKKINVADLKAQQIEIILKGLKEIYEALREIELTHRRKFVDMKLASIFSGTEYDLQKIAEAVYSEDQDRWHLAKVHVEILLKKIEDLKKAILIRGEDFHIFLNDYNTSIWTLNKLSEYFSQYKLEKEFVLCLNEAIRSFVNNFKDYAESIDNGYEEAIQELSANGEELK